MVAVQACGAPAVRGSGYVIGPRLVLTCAHAVPERGQRVDLLSLAGASTVTGVVVWRGMPGGGDDAALVEGDGPAWRGPAGPLAQWGGGGGWSRRGRASPLRRGGSRGGCSGRGGRRRPGSRPARSTRETAMSATGTCSASARRRRRRAGRAARRGRGCPGRRCFA